MKSVTDLNQALQQLQLQTKKNTEEMHTKEEVRKHAEMENNAIENEIKMADQKIHVDEQEELKLKQEIALKRKKIEENKKLVARSIQEINRMRLENQQSSSKLQSIEREYREGVEAAKKFGVNRG